MTKDHFGQQIHHKTLSLKVTYIEFDFDVSDCTMQVVTHTSKIKMMPYHSVEMINLTLSFDVLLPRGILMSKTLHRSRIRCMLLSVIEAYDQKIGHVEMVFRDTDSNAHKKNLEGTLIFRHQLA